MADDSFREIQLSGKQLIALFMAAAVVLIATFLCGVLVGRGVRVQQNPATSAESMPAAPAAVDPTAPATALKQPAPLPEPPAPQALAAQPPPVPEEAPPLQPRGQAAPAPTAAALKSTATPAAADPKTTATPAPAGAGTAPGSKAKADPASAGFFLKVVAYNTKAQADKVAAGLSVKGYPAYVEAVIGSKGTALYSVRVGKFPTRKEAEAAKLRLEQEEQHKPSIAR